MLGSRSNSEVSEGVGADIEIGVRGRVQSGMAIVVVVLGFLSRRAGLMVLVGDLWEDMIDFFWRSNIRSNADLQESLKAMKVQATISEGKELAVDIANDVRWRR